MSVTIATLADAHRHGYRIDAWCIRCETGRPVDLAAAVAAIGPDRRLADGLPLRCQACGGREVTFTISSPQADY